MVSSALDMDWITYSWLACCATAPSVAAIAVWVMFIFHTYRRRWKTVDIFLLTIALQEIPSTLCAFGYAVVTVIRTRSESSCSLIIWGLTTTRVFQMTTLTSLAFDRAMTLKWPYKYRFSVRHSQIRYHIVVLSVIAALVGVAGLFARLQYQDYRDHLLPAYLTSANTTTSNYLCTLHPYSWDSRYNIFISVLYAVLTFSTLICTIYIEVNRSRGSSRPNSRISSVGNLVSDHLGSTEAIGRSESCRTLYGFQSSKHGSINKKTLDDKKAFDLRWSTVIGSLVLCYAVNHGPYLTFMLVGLIVPFWNPLHDNVVIWLGIVEGLLIPMVLYVTDDPFRDAVKRSFKRRNYRCSDVGKSPDGSFPLYFNDFALIDKKPYLMSSIPAGSTGSALTLISNYRRSFKDNFQSQRSPNDPQMRPSNGCLSSLKKCKLPKSTDKYMFLSFYGVDKAIPLNKQSTMVMDKTSQCTNPYYKNCTTISTFANSTSEYSAKKEKQETSQRLGTVDNYPWFHANNPLVGRQSPQDISWQSHEMTSENNKDKMSNQDEHIYASLSETFSIRSTLPDKRQLNKLKIESADDHHSLESMDKACNKSGAASVDGLSISGVSFTTAANDDFEFTPGNEVLEKRCLNTIAGLNQLDEDGNDDNGLRHSRRANDKSLLPSECYSKEVPRKHVYDNLAFEPENDASLSVGTSGQVNLDRPATSQANLASISSPKYLRRYSPFAMNSPVIYQKTHHPTCYKRRGRQSFSASDIHKLESPIDALNLGNQPIKEMFDSNYLVESSLSPSGCSPRKTLSETNLLLSTKKSGSLSKIAEVASLNSTCGDRESTISDDSLCSNNSASSWDIYNRLSEALKRKREEQNSAARQNIFLSKAKCKKYRAKRRQSPTQYNDPDQQRSHHRHQSKRQPNLNQSLWPVESRSKKVTRIGSYTKDWNVNKSMPDLSSFTTCPSPVFSPLYRRDSKAIK